MTVVIFDSNRPPGEDFRRRRIFTPAGTGLVITGTMAVVPGSAEVRSWLKYPRLLRSFTAICRDGHTCWWCNKDILPGEEYEGKVWLNYSYRRKRTVVHVSKRHINPECDYDDPDECADEFGEEEGLETAGADSLEISDAA